MNSESSEKTNNSRPVLLQCTSAPLFLGSSACDLTCGCGQILIKGYDPRQYIEIDIECYSCKGVTRTDSWPVGEALPYSLLSIGREGRIALSGNINMTRNSSFICDQAIDKVAYDTAVRPGKTTLKLSLEGLDELGRDLDRISGGEYLKSLASTERAYKAKNELFLKFPLAWAISHLKRRILEGEISFHDKKDSAAVAYLNFVPYYFSRWEHHPLFAALSKGCVLEFYHTVTQLVAASYFSDYGHYIGFTNAVGVVGRSPDLYVNKTPFERCSIEVKAPSELQWPHDLPSVDKLEKIIEKQIKKARGQVTGELGGIVVVGVSAFGLESEEIINGCIKSLIKRGKVPARVTGVSSVLMNLSSDNQIKRSGWLNTEFCTVVGFFKNSRVEGGRFIKI